jgi:hypothetical protein
MRYRDKVEVRIVETATAYPHKKASPASGNTKGLNEKRWFEMAKEAYFRLGERYENT